MMVMHFFMEQELFTKIFVSVERWVLIVTVFLLTYQMQVGKNHLLIIIVTNNSIFKLCYIVQMLEELMNKFTLPLV